MLTILLMPLGAEASKVKTVHATVDVGKKKTKKVNTIGITKKWYRPRANEGGYQKTKVTGASKTYNGKLIMTTSERGHHYKFKRFSFLADGKVNKMRYYKVKYLKKNSEPQGVAIIGHKMYILMTNRGPKGKKYNHRKGHIFCYDLSVLNKYVNKSGKHNKVVKALVKSKKYMYLTTSSKKYRRSQEKKAKKNLSTTSYKIYKAVKIGPAFRAGHGQGLAYNPKDKKHLYNAAYEQNKDNGKKHVILIEKLSLSKLKPIKNWSLILRIRKKAWVKIFDLKIRWPFSDKTTGYLQIHDFTFDKNGHFYFTKMVGKDTKGIVYKKEKRGKKTKKVKTKIKRKRQKNYKPSRHESKRKSYIGRTVQVYRGTLTKKSAKVQPVYSVSNAIGTLSQGLAYRKSGNRLFFIYDSAFMSFPLNKVNKKMTENSMNFTVLSKKNYRESEGMGITSSGTGYLIMNRQAEAIKSEKTVK